MDFGQKSQIWASRGQTMSRGWKASLSTVHVAPTVPMVGTCCPTCGCAVLGSHQIIHGWFSSGPRPGGPFGPGWFWGGFSGRLGATPLCGSGWVATLKIREINFRVSLILNEIKNANRWDMQKLISLKIWLTGKLAIYYNNNNSIFLLLRQPLRHWGRNWGRDRSGVLVLRVGRQNRPLRPEKIQKKKLLKYKLNKNLVKLAKVLACQIKIHEFMQKLRYL